MSDNSSSFTKRLAVFGVAVLVTAWSITTAVNLIASVWWQLLIIVAAILAAAVVIITLWNRRH